MKKLPSFRYVKKVPTNGKPSFYYLKNEKLKPRRIKP